MSSPHSAHFQFVLAALVIVACAFFLSQSALSERSGQATRLAISTAPPSHVQGVQASPLVQPSTCGDGVCGAEEWTSVCPADCAKAPIFTFENYSYSQARNYMVLCRDSECVGRSTVLLSGGSLSKSQVMPQVSPDGRPVFAFVQNQPVLPGSISVGKCRDASCGSITYSPLVASVGNDLVGMVLVKSVPLVLYHDASNGGLYLTKCIAPDCSTHAAPVLIDSFASGHSIVLGSDGLPLLALSTISPLPPYLPSLEIVKCKNSDCTLSARATIQTPNVDPNANFEASLAVGPDKLPSLAYVFSDVLFGSHTKVGWVKCASLDCSGAPIASTILSSPTADLVRPALVMTPQNNAVIMVGSYSPGGSTYQLVQCAQPDCVQYSEISLPLVPSLVSSPSIAIDVDGVPVFTYPGSLSTVYGKCLDGCKRVTTSEFPVSSSWAHNLDT